MKISGSGPIGTTTSVKSRRSATAYGASFESELESLSSDGAAVSGGATPIATVGSLLALQETPDAAAGPAKGVERVKARAEELLEEMEGLRRGLILGAIPLETLRKLSTKVRAERALSTDQRLNEILAEIELRAEVELAKLGY